MTGQGGNSSASTTATRQRDTRQAFQAASKAIIEWARDNPQEACQAHITKVPEVQLDDCVGSLKAVMAFVFTHSCAGSVAQRG